MFAGIPTTKISEGGVDRVIEKLERAKAVTSRVISKIGGRYYWASRDNKEMTASASGAFVTFTALDGSGYLVPLGGRHDRSRI